MFVYLVWLYQVKFTYLISICCVYLPLLQEIGIGLQKFLCIRLQQAR